MSKTKVAAKGADKKSGTGEQAHFLGKFVDLVPYTS